MGKKVYGENGLPVHSFAEATEQSAKSYIAGMDSAVRHSIKGDADNYLDKKSGTRSRAWNLGYEFALRSICKYGLENMEGYSKEALGDTHRSAQYALLSMFPHDFDFPSEPPEVRRAKGDAAKPKVEPTEPKPKAVQVAAAEPEPVAVTSTCYWYDVEVAGSRKAEKGKHAGMYWIRREVA